MPKNRPPTTSVKALSDFEFVNDAHLFHQAMQHVTPLKQTDRIQINKKKPEPIKLKNNRFNSDRNDKDLPIGLPELSDHWEDVTLAQLGDNSLFKRPGINQQTMRQLARGDWLIQAQLDLHGYRLEEARVAVHEFIESCIRSRLKCVQIIHGKGLSRQLDSGALLKEKVRHWLPQFKPVLAFCQAPEKQGGAGALFVLLKVNRFSEKGIR